MFRIAFFIITMALLSFGLLPAQEKAEGIVVDSRMLAEDPDYQFKDWGALEDDYSNGALAWYRGEYLGFTGGVNTLFRVKHIRYAFWKGYVARGIYTTPNGRLVAQ